MRKLTTCFLTLLLLLVGAGCSEEKVELNEKVYNKGINITPRPQNLTEKDGKFILNADVVFVSNDEATNKVAQLFQAKLATSTGFNLKLVTETPEVNYIQFKINNELSLNNEGYVLNVSPHSVVIEAKTAHGIFYGMQSFLQLLPAEVESPVVINALEWSAKSVEIKDEPRLGYRGQMLDVCRHFSSIEYIKKQLDVLAMFKINKFHWHLTEDQAWRIEIKKYPELTKISSQRVEGEGDVYGPFFYTQEEVKDIVAYAKERFIEVIPEIELPGHGVAALAAYPEFSCTGGPFDVRNIWGVSNDIYCAGNDDTFKFLEDVISEVAPLFESKFFHIGGDEAPKSRWAECPKCQARIKAEGIKADKEHTAEEKLQSYFIRRIQDVLAKYNKNLIGWDEILEGGLAPSATVMSWRGEEGGITAGNMGHDVIMTPGAWFYLDAFQGDPSLSPVGIGSFTTLSKTYSYNPMPEALATDKRHHILGVQANVWTEYMYTSELREYYTYPRVVAVSEVGWTNEDRKDYSDFERRLDNIRVRLDMHGINYYIPVPENKNVPSTNFIAFTDNVELEFKTTEPVTIVYTTDGTEPTGKSNVYSEALKFDTGATLKLRSILASGKMGEVRTITIDKQTYLESQSTPSEYKGVKAEHFKGIMHQVKELDGLTPDEVEFISKPENSKHLVKGYRELVEDDFYSSILSGVFHVEKDDIYYFKSTADQLWIDDKLVLDFESAVKKQPHCGSSIALEAGVHHFKMVRVSGIVGGWPPLWEPLYIMMRAQGDSKYTYMNEDFYNPAK